MGIICSITAKQATFEGYCPTFTPTPDAPPIIDANFSKVPFNAEVAMASNTKRFANMMIDYIVFYLLTIMFVFVSAIVAAIFFPESTELFDNSNSSQLWTYVLVYLAYVLYYTTLEAAFGRTVGKLITGTKVVDKDGKLPRTGVIFRRSLSRLVPFEAFSFLGGDSRGWHDSWTDTWVVEKTS